MLNKNQLSEFSDEKINRYYTYCRILLEDRIKGSGLENKRSKVLVKLIENLYLLHALCQIGEHMVATSTTNHGKDICMMDENDVENSVLQK